MGPFIQRQRTITGNVEDFEVGDRVRFVGPLYLLNGNHQTRYDVLVQLGQVGTIASIESFRTVVVQWDHHQDGTDTRRGPQRIDRICLEYIQPEPEPEVLIPASMSARPGLHSGRFMHGGPDSGIECMTCGWSTDLGHYDMDMERWRVHRRTTDPTGVGY